MLVDLWVFGSRYTFVFFLLLMIIQKSQIFHLHCSDLGPRPFYCSKKNRCCLPGLKTYFALPEFRADLELLQHMVSR